MKHLFKKALTNRFFHGGMFLMGANFVVGFLNYLFNILIARSFGPSEFGDITAFYSYVIILTIPGGIITNLMIIKLGAKKDPVEYTYSIIHWLQEKSKNWWYFVTPFLLIIPFIPQITKLSPEVGYILIPFVILTYIASMYDGLLQGLHLFVWTAWISICYAIVRLLGSVIPLVGFHYLIIVVIFIILSTFVRIIWSHILITNIFKKRNIQLKKINKRLFEIWKDKQIWLTAVSGGSLVLLSNIDIIYVKQMFSPEDAGIYNSWNLFAKVILYILGPILSLSFIFFSSKKEELYHQLLFIGITLFLGFAGFMALLAYGLYGRLIIDMLFGERFYPVIPFLEWASFFGTGFVMVLFMNNYFLAKGSKKAYVLACSLPFYVGSLLIWGTDLGNVMLINIWFVFAVLTIYLLLFFKSKLLSLFQ